MREPEEIPPPRLVGALDEIDRWRIEAEINTDSAVQALAREEEDLRRMVMEAQRQLNAIVALREEQEEYRKSLDRVRLMHERDAVAQSLQEEMASMVERAQALAARVAEREGRVRDRLRMPEVNQAIREHARFEESRPELSRLPADYRAIIEEQHRSALRRLDPILREVGAGLPSMGFPLMGVAILMAREPQEGVPQALVVILPVPYALYEEGHLWPDDACSLLAARFLAGLTRLLRAVGAIEAPVQYLSIQGCLTIQVWLGDHPIRGDLQELIQLELERISVEADELKAIGVEIFGLWLPPEILEGEG